jgi:TPR repeat protein
MRTLISACLIVTLASTAFADFRSGVEAYQRGNDVTALQEFWTLARQGHAGAQFNLGVLYARGRGVAQDFSQAARWYRLAAEHGHALAQCNLGVLYEDGLGVLQNDEEARHWYQKAAAQGNLQAQANLTRMSAGASEQAHEMLPRH